MGSYRSSLSFVPVDRLLQELWPLDLFHGINGFTDFSFVLAKDIEMTFGM